MTCRFRKVVNDLPRNNNVLIIKQDKGREEVIMDRKQYF